MARDGRIRVEHCAGFPDRQYPYDADFFHPALNDCFERQAECGGLSDRADAGTACWAGNDAPPRQADTGLDADGRTACRHARDRGGLRLYRIEGRIRALGGDAVARNRNVRCPPCASFAIGIDGDGSLVEASCDSPRGAILSEDYLNYRRFRLCWPL